MSEPVIFRAEPKRASDEEICLRNEGRAGDPFLPAEEELRLLAVTSPTRVTEAEARRWVEHPDESVACLFARLVIPFRGERRSSGRMNYVGEYEVVGRLMGRALEEAHAEGLAWTPLLDVLAEEVEGESSTGVPVGFGPHVERLRDWLAQVEEAEELAGLVRFHSHLVRHLLLSRARTLPEVQIPHWLRSRDDFITALHNPLLMERHGAAIVLHLLTLDRKTVGELPAELERLDGAYLAALPAEVQEEMIGRGLRGKHLGALSVLLSKLPRVSAETVGQVLATWAGREANRVAAWLHPHCPPEARAKLLAGDVFSKELLTHPHTDAEILEVAYRKKGAAVASWIFAHPRVPRELALRIVRGWTDRPEDLRKGETPRAAFYPEVALELVRILAPLQACSLLQRMSEEGYPLKPHPLAGWAVQWLVQKAWRANAHPEILTTLEGLAERGPLMLDRATQAMMLADSDAEVRERTLRLAGRIRLPLEEEKQALALWASSSEPSPAAPSAPAQGRGR